MSSLWEKKFKAENVQSPKVILDEQAEALSEMTKGMIVAKTVSYDGPMRSYKNHDPISALTFSLEPRDYNVQNDLGEIEGSKFRYEFFITSVSTPNFKYRVMIFEHDITYYPVNLTLDDTISKELGLKSSYLNFNSAENFIAFLRSILNSNKIENVINALLSLDSGSIDEIEEN